MNIRGRHNDKAESEISDTWSVTIEGRKGDQVLEIVEQMGGGFSITARGTISSKLIVRPLASNVITVEDKP